MAYYIFRVCIKGEDGRSMREIERKAELILNAGLTDENTGIEGVWLSPAEEADSPHVDMVYVGDEEQEEIANMTTSATEGPLFSPAHMHAARRLMAHWQLQGYTHAYVENARVVPIRILTIDGLIETLSTRGTVVYIQSPQITGLLCASFEKGEQYKIPCEQEHHD